ncbi:MFS transporter [Neisseria zoodegmatis]|uniref:Integral membrane protein n=1 Tax=Neisseria zoodegmatis TaxID=326523 RepID=A0AB38DQ33_9NEIS|nr:MFS transporter [Neisseria zoodegmatis]OSI09695.1 MFS transporter [Neisseria zoodegmatis]SNU79525.1 integral membrane protein [Neisseria zoodegmatis]
MIQNRCRKAASEQNVSLLLRLAVMLVGLSAFLQVYSVQAILPLLVQDLAATEVQAGLSVGATVLGVALISPFMGMLSDAIGRKVFIVSSLLFLAVPTALLAGAQTIEQMMLWRFLQGVAVPGITVVLIAYIGEEFDAKTMTRLMSLYVTGTVLGGFLGRFILGHLSEIMGWRQAFYVMACLTVVSAFFVWKQLPASQRFVAKPHFQTALRTLSGHLKNRYVVAACLLGACLLCSLVGCFTYINLHLAEEPYSLDSGSLANLFTVYLIGMVITPLSARLINRFGSAPTIILAVALSAAGVIGTLTAPLPAVIAALALMSSGVFITQAATISYIAANVKEGRSLASGLYYMAYYGGGTLGAWLCGLAYRHYGWPGVAGVLLSVQAFALLITVKGMLRPSEK